MTIKEINVWKEIRLKIIKEIENNPFELFKSIFDEFDYVNEIYWNQYTPYFNDGDTCEFSVNLYSIEVNSITLEQSLIEEVLENDNEVNENKEILKNYIGGYFEKKYINSKIGDIGLKYKSSFSNIGKPIQLVRDILSGIPDDIMKNAFGDHTEVIIKKDGTVKKHRFEHD